MNQSSLTPAFNPHLVIATVTAFLFSVLARITFVVFLVVSKSMPGLPIKFGVTCRAIPA